MNLETSSAKLEYLYKFKLDKSLEKYTQDRIHRIKSTIKKDVFYSLYNWDLDSLNTTFQTVENAGIFFSSDPLNFVSGRLQDYFKSGNKYSANKIVENYLVETQVQDFQHSSICNCFVCCSNSDKAKNNATQGNQNFENVAFFNAGGSKWSQPGGLGSPVDITYSYSNLLDGSILGISSSDIKAAIEEAFEVWSSVAPLNFTEVEDSSGNPQIRIGQESIDGRNGTLAFAYFPTNGDIRFDNGENWNTSLFLETAVHEIGHSLGLAHESGTEAIMNPTIQNRYSGLGTGFLLQDDINGIRSIYGSGSGSVTPLGGTPPASPPDSTPTPPNSGFNGTSGNDILIGDNQANTILGLAGNDYIEGRPGLDTIDGGPGNDTVSYSYGSSGFTWDMNTERLIFNSGGSETIRNVENIIGSQSGDRITTNGVNNTIEGAGGPDTFAFSSLDGSFDRIVDYSRAEGDTIEVSSLGFVTGSGFSYNSSSGFLSYGNQEFVVLENKPSFSDVAAGFVIT